LADPKLAKLGPAFGMARGKEPGCRTLALLLVSIHRSAWKVNSATSFALTEFSEVWATARRLRCWRKMFAVSDEIQRSTAIDAQAKNDGLRLLRAIDATQAHGREGARVDPSRAAYEAGLAVGDGSDRYQRALHYLIEEAALVGDENTAFDIGEERPHGYALYFYTQRAVELLGE
jgi:hypothetical protein